MKRNLKRLATIFSRAIHERHVKTSHSLIECALEEAEVFGIEQTEIPKFLTPEILALFHIEATKMKQLKPEARDKNMLAEFFKVPGT